MRRRDGIGRRDGLKIRWANNPCGFDPRRRHQSNIIRTEFSMRETGSDYLFILRSLRIRISETAWSSARAPSRECRKRRTIMKNIKSCEFDMNTGCAELLFQEGHYMIHRSRFQTAARAIQLGNAVSYIKNQRTQFMGLTLTQSEAFRFRTCIASAAPRGQQRRFYCRTKSRN